MTRAWHHWGISSRHVQSYVPGHMHVYTDTTSGIAGALGTLASPTVTIGYLPA